MEEVIAAAVIQLQLLPGFKPGRGFEHYNRPNSRWVCSTTRSSKVFRRASGRRVIQPGRRHCYCSSTALIAFKPERPTRTQLKGLVSTLSAKISNVTAPLRLMSLAKEYKVENTDAEFQCKYVIQQGNNQLRSITCTAYSPSAVRKGLSKCQKLLSTILRHHTYKSSNSPITTRFPQRQARISSCNCLTFIQRPLLSLTRSCSLVLPSTEMTISLSCGTFSRPPPKVRYSIRLKLVPSRRPREYLMADLSMLRARKYLNIEITDHLYQDDQIVRLLPSRPNDCVSAGNWNLRPQRMGLVCIPRSHNDSRIGKIPQWWAKYRVSIARIVGHLFFQVHIGGTGSPQSAYYLIRKLRFGKSMIMIAISLDADISTRIFPLQSIRCESDDYHCIKTTVVKNGVYKTSPPIFHSQCVDSDNVNHKSSWRYKLRLPIIIWQGTRAPSATFSSPQNSTLGW